MKIYSQDTSGENKPHLASTQPPKDLPEREALDLAEVGRTRPCGLPVRGPGATNMRFSFQMPTGPTGWCLTGKQCGHPSLWHLGLGTVTVQPVWGVEPGRSQRTGSQSCGGEVATARGQPRRSGTFRLSPVSYARVSPLHPSSRG